MTLKRRDFLKSTSTAFAAASVLGLTPWEAIANERRRVPFSDKINVGVIGINGMGWADLQSMMKIAQVNPVAVCDVDQNVIGKRVGELDKMGVKKIQTHRDYRKLLDDKDIDVVIIGTPDHWHCLQMVDACAAGKDVYVEKPIGNSIEECNVMVAAQKKYNRAVQVGQWQRSMPHFVDALNYLRTGKIGKIRMVKAWAFMGWMNNIPVKPDGTPPPGVDYTMWLGPATTRPFNENRFHFNFRWFWDYAGGLMTDWGVHLVDYVLLGMNDPTPKSVIASGGKYAYPDGAHETPDTLTTIYEFDGFTMLWEHAQGIGNGNYGNDHGIAYIGNNGTLVLHRGGWQVIPEKGKMEEVPFQPSKGSGLDAHTINFIDAVESRKLENLTCPIHAGAHVARVCQMGNISYKTGASVHWADGGASFKETAATQLMAAHYNNGYKVPAL